MMENSKQNSAAWWNSRRLAYNVGLVVSGISAFICYVVAIYTFDLHMKPIPGSREPVEITLFTIGFQAIGYLFMMGLANVCYGLGQFSERLIRPAEVDSFRRQVFAFGFCFSVFLPFTIPLSIVLNHGP